MHTETQDRILLVITIGWAALWSALPFLLGTVPVAEERKQGTLESALTLPARRSSQVAVKLGVALCLGLLLGAVLPWLIAGLGFQFGLRSGPFTTAFDLDGLKALAILMVCIISICFYASTLSRTTLQAMGVAILFVLLLGSLFFFAPGMTQPLGHPSWSWISWKLNALVGIPAITLCFLVLARWNFRQLQIGRGDWIRNVVMWPLTVALIFASTSAIYHRCWEYFTPLEPAHGPWQLFGSVRPQIGFSGQKLFVLLPDGRLWTSKHSREQYLYAGGGVRNGEAVQYPVYCPVPVDGEFIGGSNWVKLATSWGRAYAIQSDGTLWRIPVRPGRPESTDSQPVREGIDTDWSDVAAGANFFLVLKRDGTVWGWGDNNSGQLGPGPRAITNFLVRVGTNSDWAAVFANLGTSVGVKRDGSVWKWGDLLNGPHGRKGWKSGAYPEPVRWDMSGADWVKVADHGSSMLALQRDGYLMWEWDVPDKSTGSARRPQSSACRDFSENNHWLLIVKTDGTLIRHDWMSEWNGFGWGSMDQPSKKSDWLAVKASWSDPWVALASDGTLCAWWEGDPGEYAMGRMWLGPSRRPLWSLNILARSK